MREYLISDFRDQVRIRQAIGALTDAGVTRDHMTVLSLTDGEAEDLLALVGEGQLAARLRLEGRTPSLQDCLHWIGLEQEESERLERVLSKGGSVVVVSLPAGPVDGPAASAIMAKAGADNSLRMQTVGAAESSTRSAVEIRTTIGDEPVERTFVTVKEVVTVERRKVRRRATEGDMRYFKEDTYTFKETMEKLMVEKVPYVTEEVVVDTQRVLDEQAVEDRVRKLRAEINEL